MDFRITAEERATFKRCRRQWDFGSPHRRDLEPTRPAEVSLPDAIKDALAVYYYPGTWDWQRAFVLSLVHKAFERSVRAHPGAAEAARVTEAGTALLERYSAWAPALDDFAPVRIDHDVEGLVPDPRDPERGMLTSDGRRVTYAGRVDLLAVDSADAYWVVRHQVVADWQDVELLVLDEQAVAACWAWEQQYLGMEIAGTIHNELRTSPSVDPAPSKARRWGRRRVAQHEPSGGGRSIPQHRRRYARPIPAATTSRVEQREAGPVRRTRVRRSRDEIAAAGRLIGLEALEIIHPELTTYPTPDAHCRTCSFAAPCLAMTEGTDPDAVLAAGYHRRLARKPKPRLGQTTWSVGRGAAPPPNW